MKLILTTSLVLSFSLVFVGVSNARDSHNYTDTARVLKTKPIYETVQVAIPDRRCHARKHHRHSGYNNYSRPSSNSYTTTIAGAVLGGIVGNQFGKGRGKTAMTVAGAVLGGSLGNDYTNNQRTQPFGVSQQRCEDYTRYESRQEIVGYKVKYRYNGKKFWTRTSYKPGSTIQVSVSVNPNVQQDHHYSTVNYESTDYDMNPYDDAYNF